MFYRGWPKSYSYSTTLAAMEARALDGCTWCQFLIAAIRTEPTYDPASRDVPFNLTVGAYVEEDTDENQTALKNSQCIFVVTDKSPIFIGIVHTAPGELGCTSLYNVLNL